MKINKIAHQSTIAIIKLFSGCIVPVTYLIQGYHELSTPEYSQDVAKFGDFGNFVAKINANWVINNQIW